MDPERLDINRGETARSGSGPLFLAGLLLLSVFSTPLAATPPELEEDQGLTGFGLALRRLPATGSLLCITAHPDDEHNAVLAKVSRGRGIRTALLSLTRGDGGQNEIGPELFEALGVLRTQELMRVHRFDGARLYFTRAYEFGYSFSVEETLERWGEEVLRDVVRVIREFRPDVIVTLNPHGAGGDNITRRRRAWPPAPSGKRRIRLVSRSRSKRACGRGGPRGCFKPRAWAGRGETDVRPLAVRPPSMWAATILSWENRMPSSEPGPGAAIAAKG